MFEWKWQVMVIQAKVNFVDNTSCSLAQAFIIGKSVSCGITYHFSPAYSASSLCVCILNGIVQNFYASRPSSSYPQ